MKYLILSTTSLLLFSCTLFGQIAPTLSVGLEALTMNKGTIDVKLLTEIIMDKQRELKQEALKRFMLSMFPETNFTTRFYVQNCLNILLNEKNKQVIEKQILELTTNYALSLGVAKVYQFSLKKGALNNVNKAYKNFRNNSIAYKSALINNYNAYSLTSRKLSRLNGQIKDKKKEINVQLNTINGQSPDSTNEASYKKLAVFENDRKDLEKKVSRIRMRENFPEAKVTNGADSLPFGLLLDVVSASLSEIKPLKTKGFFRDAINYRTDVFYRALSNINATADDKAFKSELDKLSDIIKEEISHYVENYEIIKELFSEKVDANNEPIDIALIKNYFNSIITISGGIENFTNQVTITISNMKPLIAPQKDLPAKSAQKEKITSRTSKTGNKNQKPINDQLSTYVKNLNELSEYKVNLSNYKITVEALKSYVQSAEKIRQLQNVLTAQFDTAKVKGDTLTIKDYANYSKINSVDSTAVDSVLMVLGKQYKEIENDSSAIFIGSQQKILKRMLESIPLKDRLLLTVTETTVIAVDTLIKRILNREEVIHTDLSTNVSGIIQTGNFLAVYLNDLIEDFVSLKRYAISDSIISQFNKEALENYSELLSKAYLNLTIFAKQEKVSLKDINYIDQELVPNLIKYGIIFNKEPGLQDGIKQFRLLSQLLKIKAVINVGSLPNFDTELVKLFEFIANLDNLDHAETFQAMINIFRDVNILVEDNLDNGDFKDTYLVFSNAVKKYTLINSKEQYVEIEVVGFLTDLQQYFDRKNTSRFGLYLTLGINQSIFFSQPELPRLTDASRFLGFASEKLGVKYRFASFNRIRDYENTIKNDVNINKRQPFINQFYGVLYGSGLLYSIANTTTSDLKFDYPHIGIGAGVRFYNALDINLFAGFPFVKDESIWRNAFWGIGLDIPLGEYLEKLNNKK